jgi:carboxyl-terminal processing protease
MKCIPLFCILLASLNVTAQAPAAVLLDSVIERTRQTSLYAAQVNWDSLRKAVHSNAANAGTVQELGPAFTTLLNGLRDMHGRILDAKSYSTLGRFTDYAKLYHPDTRVRDDKTWALVNDTALHFSWQMLSDKTGYLRITAISPREDAQQEAAKIRAAVIELAAAGATKWVIDLRYNGGGNMHPMVSGIAPLIGDGIVGSLVNLAGEKQFEWEIKGSNFIYFGVQPVTLPAKPVFKKMPKIAVLTSRWTVSSGELVATCLKGRPRTRFFGEATGSLTTNNNWEIIDGQVIINISTGIYCDRNGVAYRYNIPVDAELPFEPGKDPEEDGCIKAARQWLNGK